MNGATRQLELVVQIVKVWHDSRQPMKLDRPMPLAQAAEIVQLLNDLNPEATYVLRSAGAP